MDYWKYLEASTDLIEKNLTEELSLQQIAASVGCSAYHFSRIFREHTGHPVMEYVRHRRLVHSTRLLYCKSSISNIAGQYGYSTAGGFIRAFKREFGLTPDAYRRLIKERRSGNAVGDTYIKHVEDFATLRLTYDFGDRILNYTRRGERLYSWEFWQTEFGKHPNLLAYAARAEEIYGAVWGWVGDNNNVTLGMVAVDPRHRRRGIGKRLVEYVRDEARRGGHPIIALGAREGAESFYLACGFTPTLFLQSRRPLSELRELNYQYEEIWAVESDERGWSKLILKTPCIDRELRGQYDERFEDCVPQTVFLMFL